MERFKRRIFPTSRKVTMAREKRNEKAQRKMDAISWVLMWGSMVLWVVLFCLYTSLLFLPLFAMVGIVGLIYHYWIREWVEG